MQHPSRRLARVERYSNKGSNKFFNTKASLQVSFYHTHFFPIKECDTFMEFNFETIHVVFSSPEPKARR